MGQDLVANIYACSYLYDSGDWHMKTTHALFTNVNKKRSTDQQNALTRDCILIKRFRHLFTFTRKALTITDVPARLAHFTHSTKSLKIERPKGN